MKTPKIWKPKIRYTVYRIRNTVNARCYVGSTLDPHSRLAKHRYDLTNRTHQSMEMTEDWHNLGAGTFSFEIIEVYIRPSRRFEREQFWIDAEQAFPNGYNRNPNARSATGSVRSDEQREVTRRSALAQFSDTESRVKTSEATKVAMSDPKLRKKISDSAKRKFASPEYWQLRQTAEGRAILSARAKEARKVRERERSKRRKRVPVIKQYHYRITLPDGSSFLVAELRQFCRQAGIWPSAAYEMIAGENRDVSAKGHKFERLEGPFPGTDRPALFRSR